MNIPTGKYPDVAQTWPQSGQHILASHNADSIVIYQAYNNAIADYAVKNQRFGGPDYSYDRMSWIKPNFLWMMYRSGWAGKSNQERILAVTISKQFFDHILSNAAPTTFKRKIYDTKEAWQEDMLRKEARLQWDPDHDPYGRNLERRAIQLGMRGDILSDFGTRQIVLIEDITPFVLEQRNILDRHQLDNLIVPAETIYVPSDHKLQAATELAGASN